MLTDKVTDKEKQLVRAEAKYFLRDGWGVVTESETLW